MNKYGLGTSKRQNTVFVLGSASTARAKTLRSAGIEPLIRVSDADEDAILAKFPDSTSAIGAEQKVIELAKAKARSVAAALTEGDILEFAKTRGMAEPRYAIVVGCDSMLEVNGKLVGKPHSAEVAIRRIRELAGANVVLHTGHAAIKLKLGAKTNALSETENPAALTPFTQQGERVDSCATRVHFGQFTEAEIHAYVATGEPLEVAGAFTIDGLGGAFIEGVSGDPHSVVGISLPLVRKLANSLGIFWPSLWNGVQED